MIGVVDPYTMDARLCEDTSCPQVVLVDEREHHCAGCRCATQRSAQPAIRLSSRDTLPPWGYIIQ